MSLPTDTNILIVGAGPSGMACALSLAKQGVTDITIVDAVQQAEQSSRALVIHAATLEALDSISVAETIIDLGIKVSETHVFNRKSRLVTINFDTLRPYTRYPFGLIIPQHVTERVLGGKVNAMGIRIHRPCKVVGMRGNDQDRRTIDISFEGGEVVRAKYVVGADGSHSPVRQIAGIGFVDPDGQYVSGDEINAFSQMILADVAFSSRPKLPVEGSSFGVLSSDNFFLIAPLPASAGSTPEVPLYRVVCGVPAASGPPPSKAQTPYIQDLVDRYGHVSVSSDPAVNENPVKIAEIIWSSRFRTRSAVADRFFTRFGGSNAQEGGVVCLVGDAAHIHSPAGGQGMNLGLRDAVILGPAIAAHMKDTSPNADAILESYATLRRDRALTVIGMVKGIVSRAEWITTAKGLLLAWMPGIVAWAKIWSLWLMGKSAWVRRRTAWNLSGLGMP